MKPIQIHPLSTLLGAGLLGLALVAAGMTSQQTLVADRLETRIVVEGLEANSAGSWVYLVLRD